ncbi:hypothetical protein CDAR_615171 [Caerostris darwini]|uniref:Uncharacterized protein n=1 Tax=Caerostris darwini TaxID=1538125 RepID=A0AAV4R840_9ARAC|nr:hypothetical protein CDAR_615171 [Caerostris darwini]
MYFQFLINKFCSRCGHAALRNVRINSGNSLEIVVQKIKKECLVFKRTLVSFETKTLITSDDTECTKGFGNEEVEMYTSRLMKLHIGRRNEVRAPPDE